MGGGFSCWDLVSLHNTNYSSWVKLFTIELQLLFIHYTPLILSPCYWLLAKRLLPNILALSYLHVPPTIHSFCFKYFAFLSLANQILAHLLHPAHTQAPRSWPSPDHSLLLCSDPIALPTSCSLVQCYFCCYCWLAWI